MNKTEGWKIDTHICKVDGCFRPKASHIGYCTKHFQQWKKHGKINIETERKAIKDDDVCQVDGCNTKVFAKGYCQKHYQQKRNYGKILAKGERKAERIIYKGKCIVEGCENEQLSKGLCAKHYADMKKLEEPNESKINKNKQKVCSVKDCKNFYYAKGYCQIHYNQYYHNERKLKNESESNVDNKSRVYEIGKPRKRTKGVDKCSIDGCEELVKAKGYCNKHYTRFLNHGDPNIVKNQKYTSDTCKFEGCDRKVHAKGYCQYHYKKFLKNGDIMSKNSENDNKICLAEGCNEIAKTKGYCPKHYYKFKTYGDPLKENKIGMIKTCTVEGCNEKHKALGYCQKHYSQHKAREEAKLRKGNNMSIPKAKSPNCRVEWCDGKNEVNGYCLKHYKQIRKYQRILTEYETEKIKRLKCMKENCTNKTYRLGYCKEHYNEYYHGDDLKVDNIVNNKQPSSGIKEIENVTNDTKKASYSCDKCGKESESISVMDFKPFYDTEETISVNLCNKCSNELIKWMIKRN